MEGFRERALAVGRQLAAAGWNTIVHELIRTQRSGQMPGDPVPMRAHARVGLAVAVAVLLALVAAGCYPSITIEPDQLPETATGQPYSQIITARGAEIMGMYTTGSLPPGLTFEYDRVAGHGVISGTPTTSGTHTFGIVAYGPQFNSGGSEATLQYTLVVR